MKRKTSSRAVFGIATGKLLDPSILFAANRLPMWISDVESSRFLEVNQAALQQYGYTREEFLSLTIDDILPCDASHSPCPGELDQACIHITRNGTRIFVVVHAHDFQLDDRQLQYVVAEDVTARQHVQTELHRLAHHDALTGLPNRTLLEQKTHTAFEAARKHGHHAAVICLDLDRFKQVNDTFGHAVGDAVLRAFSDRVRENTRRIDVLVRRGGEEFVLILPATTTDQATALAERVRSAVGATPIELPGDVRVAQTVSLGVVRWDGSEDGESLVHRADVAMYAAKEAGRNRVVVG
jgi:diguanylate cyclase (GGDEF)-like protein